MKEFKPRKMSEEVEYEAMMGEKETKERTKVVEPIESPRFN